MAILDLRKVKFGHIAVHTTLKQLAQNEYEVIINNGDITQNVGNG